MAATEDRQDGAGPCSLHRSPPSAAYADVAERGRRSTLGTSVLQLLISSTSSVEVGNVAYTCGEGDEKQQINHAK